MQKKKKSTVLQRGIKKAQSTEEDHWMESITFSRRYKYIYEMKLTYSWLMTFVVFSKSHKADSEGLKTGTNGWSKLDSKTDKRHVFNQRY